MSEYEWVIGFIIAIVAIALCVYARSRCPMGGKHNLETLPEFGPMTYGCTKCGNIITGIDRKGL